MSDKYAPIVSRTVLDTFAEYGRQSSQADWSAGDLALAVIANYRNRREQASEKEEGERDDLDHLFLSTYEFEIWNLISTHYGKNIKPIAEICASFPASGLLRGKFSHWPIGYFRQVMTLEEDEREQAFDFLEMKKKTEYRKLGVGEFMFQYRTQIQGKILTEHSGEEPQPPVEGMQNEKNGVSGRFYARMGIQTFLSATRGLRSVLVSLPQTERVRGFLDDLNRINERIPEIIEELQDEE